jgi:iron complex outermembrane recepter protein
MCPNQRTGRSLRSICFYSALGSWCAAFPAIGWAADTPAEIDAASAEPLQEIIVTAQKREQRAQDVAITLNVYTGTELTDAGVLMAPDIAKLTPGVGIAGSYGGQNVTFSIRGVAQQDFTAIAEAPIAVYLDEGYMAANNAAGLALFDVDRVEVLKGPQGTLFGRNATGGLVSILTQMPTKEFSANASLSDGAFNDVRAETAVSGPLSDAVQGRVAVLYEQNDPWVTNTSRTGGNLGGQETTAGRVRLEAEPSESADLLFTAYAIDVEQSWGPYFLESTRSVVNDGVPNSIIVPQNTLFGQPASNAKDLTVDANDAQNRENSGSYNKVYGGTLRFKYDLGSGAELTAISDYARLTYDLKLDDDASAISFLNSLTSAKVENWSEEVRLFKDFSGARLTSGLYYLHIDSSQTDLEELYGLGGIDTSSPAELVTNSYSGFTQAEYDIAPTVTLVGGVRATREDKSYQFNSYLETLEQAPIAPDRSYHGDLAEWLYSWKAQVEYRPTRDILIFGGYSRGAKAGSFNVPFAGGATPTDADIPYKPEKLNSFEIGSKTTLLGGLMTLNGAVFYYDYQDYQAFKFINFSTVVTNNPATIKGAEASLNVRPTRQLELLAGISYVDAVVDDVFVSNSLGSAVLSRRPPYSSKWTANASARYEIPLAGGTLSLLGNVQYIGDNYFSLTNFDATYVASYTLLNARVAWTAPSNHLELFAFGKNLSDQRYRTVGFDASDFGGFTQVAYGQPRWWGVGVSYKY